MVTGINRDSEQTLASILSSGELLAPGEALDLLREIVRRVVDLHSSGQLHLGITLDAISTGPDGIKLKMTEEGTASLESLRELLRWSPEASHRLPRSLPTNFVAARQMLHSARVSTDPCMFDLLAIGDIFCRILTGESSAAYRQSVRVKGLIPVEFRTLLERLLGADGQLTFESAQSLWDFLQEHYRGDSEAHTAVPGRAVDFQPAPTPTGCNANTGVALKQADNGTAPRPVDRSVAAQGNADLQFQKLGHFEIQARIGRGGMGDVYRAYERALDRTVAIKVLPAEFAGQTDFVRRFQAEASAVARLVHPNIIQIYFIGIDSGHHFFAMQYIDGFSLAVLLNQKKKLSVKTAVSLVEQVLLGLQEAHSQGFVHRDIKPGNILIDRVKQRALLADFGLAKMVEGSETGMTATGVILGTVDYLSPEQALGKDVDRRSDLYSIGVLFYHILSGRLPFIADTPTALMFQHVYEQPRPLSEVAPQVANQLAAIVDKLLQKNPADRYQSARDVLTDLAAFRKEQPLVIASQSSSDCSDDVVRSAPTSASPIENHILPSSLAEDAESVAEISGWEQWLTRWRAKFQQHAPQRLLDLQNTQQQLLGGLAIYETRRENLKMLVKEAQEVRDELARAAAQSRGTSDAASLEQQLAVQDEQLGELKLKLAKVSSTLQQLLSQRDLLNARLKAAGAQLKSDRHITAGWLSRRKLLLLAATATLVVAAVVFRGQLVRQSSVPSTGAESNASVEGASVASVEGASVTVSDNGQRLRNSIGMEFVRISPGSFMMGSPLRELGRDPDEHQHLVRITQPFFMGIHEVTRGQFEQFVAATGYRTNAETDGKGGWGEYPGVGGRYEKRFTWRDSGYEQTSEHPVGNVTWYDASAFVRWLSEKENVVYRLPTEAEAEYACRAGSQTPFQTGTVAADVVILANVVDQTFCDELITKYKQDVSKLKSTPGSDGFVFTAPVGSFPANPFGLHDMIGNVDEWCSDWFDHNYFRHSPVNDPTGPETGVFRSFRGGFWGSIIQHTRCANRSRFEPDHRANYIGFRVVRDFTPEPL